MFRLNLKIALRNLWRSRVSALINVIGLAAGLAACLMLLIYVAYEWNFDKQSRNSAQLYQTLCNITDDSGKIFMTFDGTTTAFAPLVRQMIPEVKLIARMDYGGSHLIANGSSGFKKNGRFSEPDLLKMYDYQFISGNPRTAMSSPRSVILTEGMARILFGTADVLNRSVRFDNRYDLSVTGVIRDLPDNSSNKFDFLMPWSFYEAIDESARDLNWNNYSYLTLVSLAPGADLSRVNQKIDALVRKNSKTTSQPFFLYPLEKLHLYGKFTAGKSVGGKIQQLWLFMGLAFGILLIACINFMNMATAKSEKRAREVGIKKTIGATRMSLILQFLTESMVLTLISVVLAIAIVEISLPAFGHLLQMDLQMSYFKASSWLGLMAIVLFTGLAAGSYPAFYLSSFRPVQTFKKRLKSRRLFAVSLRELLVISQFSFTIMLIISTLVIYRQIQFIRNRPVGAEIKTLVEMPKQGELHTKFEMLKSQLLKSGAVTGIYASSSGLVHHDNNFNNMEWPGMSQAKNSILFNRVSTTYDYVSTAGLKLLQGRDFSPGFASDTAAVLLSASAVKIMDLKNPVGQLLTKGGQPFTVIGVFQDYIWDSPYKTNNPMILFLDKTGGSNITMKLNPARPVRQNLSRIEQITKEINPAYPVELSFTGNAYAELFRQERTLGILSNVFGTLAIVISCLGLYGLAAYSAEQRTKEFGIRKVLGASVGSLVQLLSLSFVRMVGLAILIALPAAGYLMSSWLSGFEFHTGVPWWILAIAALGTMLIALLTVSYQAYKSAAAEPVNALKHE